MAQYILNFAIVIEKPHCTVRYNCTYVFRRKLHCDEVATSLSTRFTH